MPEQLINLTCGAGYNFHLHAALRSSSGCGFERLGSDSDFDYGPAPLQVSICYYLGFPSQAFGSCSFSFLTRPDLREGWKSGFCASAWLCGVTASIIHRQSLAAGAQTWGSQWRTVHLP
jgi:hypothetical protein